MEKSKEVYLFHQGTYYHAYNLLGCHPEGEGAWFRVWAPNARAVSVVGDFNNWDAEKGIMTKIENSTIWEVYIEKVKQYDNYKYQIEAQNGRILLKADPYAIHSETCGGTASKVYDLKDFDWTDNKYYERISLINHYEKPMNIYEVNFASWKRREDGSYYSYKMLADELIPYVIDMGYTHIEIMPITEYPYDRSWGYQVTGYYSVTSRFGTPDDFRYFVNKCHENNIGVIIDWVPAHFPKDPHGLVEFDGGYCYENQGVDRMEYESWGTRRFDHGRNEVQCFLIGSVNFFIDKFHIDGVRVDAVASMLYLDYDKKDGEWIPNVNGDNKNLEAIAFLRKLNAVVLTEYSNVITIAEESTSWPMVTKPSTIGGLGFNYKWNIGWMNDTFEYVSIDPFFRKDNHNKLTFSMFYAFSENFILPISHDEVVYGKRSLLNKMYGDYNQKFDLMRTFMMYMFAHPGKKLTFMGTEFAQFDEWNHDKGIDFLLLDFEKHNKMKTFIKELNHFYKSNSELYEIDYSWEGFKWLTADDRCNNVVAFERRNKKGEVIVCVANFSPVPHENYRVGVEPGKYIEIFNSNYERFGGSGITCGDKESESVQLNGFDSSIVLNLEPNSAVFFKKEKFSVTVESKFNNSVVEEIFNEKNQSTPTIEAKNVVTKIIESRKQNRQDSDYSDFDLTDRISLKLNIDGKKIEAKDVIELIKKQKSKRSMEIISLNEIVDENNSASIVNDDNQNVEVSSTHNQINDVPVKVKRKAGRPRNPVNPNKVKRGRGRPRKPVDPNAPPKTLRGRGRPRKPVDPDAPPKLIRGRGRPRKPVDPNAPPKALRGRGRPRKPVDPNAPPKIIRGRGRPKKVITE